MLQVLHPNCGSLQHFLSSVAAFTFVGSAVILMIIFKSVSLHLASTTSGFNPILPFPAIPRMYVSTLFLFQAKYIQNAASFSLLSTPSSSHSISISCHYFSNLESSVKIFSPYIPISNLSNLVLFLFPTQAFFASCLDYSRNFLAVFSLQSHQPPNIMCILLTSLPNMCFFKNHVTMLKNLQCFSITH